MVTSSWHFSKRFHCFDDDDDDDKDDDVDDDDDKNASDNDDDMLYQVEHKGLSGEI